MKDTHVLSRAIVLDRIEKHPGVSNQELSAMLGWTINRVTPRVKELLDAGQIVVVGRKMTVYNRPTRCYAVRGQKA